jgi:hypothetical protein
MDELNKKVGEILQHAGIKGMRWGIRRDRNRPGGADGKEESIKVKDDRGPIRKRLDSMKRERQWKEVVKQMDKLSTKDINTVAKRIQQENSLKTLSKTVGNKKDKADYLRRENMSDAELSRKVKRLQAKESLTTAVGKASKEQREMGEKVIEISKTIGVKFAIAKLGGKKPGISEIYDILNNPKESYKKSKNELIETKVSNDALKDVLKKLSSTKKE